MTCDQARELFSERIDGRLDARADADVSRHLATCPACARDFSRFEQTVAALHSLSGDRAPMGFVDGVLARARRESWLRRTLRAAFLPLPRKLPLEAAAVVLVGILTVLLYRESPDLDRAGDRIAVRRESARPTGAPLPSSPGPVESEKRPSAVATLPAPGVEGLVRAPRPEERHRTVGPAEFALRDRQPAENLPAPPAGRAEPRADAVAESDKRKDAPEGARGPDLAAGAPAAPAPRGPVPLSAPPPQAALPEPTTAAPSPAVPPPSSSAPMTAQSPLPPATRSESTAPPVERRASMDRATRALRPDEAKESAVQKSSEVPAQYQAPALRGSTRVAPQAGLMAAVSPPLRAMLRVSDRTESERAIRELVGRLGATALWDTPEPSVVTITMTRARLAELLIGLRELGDLKMDARGDELPDRVTLLLRLGS